MIFRFSYVSWPLHCPNLWVYLKSRLHSDQSRMLDEQKVANRHEIEEIFEELFMKVMHNFQKNLKMCEGSTGLTLFTTDDSIKKSPVGYKIISNVENKRISR